MLEAYDDILTPEEVSEALRIGETALYRLLNSGALKAFRNGRRWVIPKEAVIAYIRDQAGLFRP